MSYIHVLLLYNAAIKHTYTYRNFPIYSVHPFESWRQLHSREEKFVLHL